MVLADRLVLDDIGQGGQGADPQAVGVLAYEIEAFDGLEVDQHLRIHRMDLVLEDAEYIRAARDDDRPLAICPDLSYGVIERLCRDMFEFSHSHGCTLSPFPGL